VAVFLICQPIIKKAPGMSESELPGAFLCCNDPASRPNNT